MSKILFFLFVVFTANLQAQEPTQIAVEKSVWGVQTGLLGIWAHNESRLTSSIALRSELGFDGGFWGAGDTFDYALLPVLRIEPRWYRNLNRRVRKGKSIAGNSADFLSLKFALLPDLFSISSEDTIDVVSSAGVTFNAGMRRVYGQHFSFELGLGAGVAANLEEPYLSADPYYFLPDIFLRLGYSF